MSLLAAVERIRAFAGPADELWLLSRPVLESGAFTDRKVAIHALARHPEVGSLVPTMLDAVAEHSDPALRTGVVEVLGRSGTQLLRSLIDAAETRSASRLRLLAEVYGSLGAPALVPALTRMLRQDDPNVRFAAIEALGRIGTPTAAEALLQWLPLARDTGERFVVLEALTQCAARRALPADPLRPLIPLREDPVLTRPLLRLVGTIADPAADRFLWDWLAELSPIQLQEAAKALGATIPELLAERTARLGPPNIELGASALKGFLRALDPELRAGAVWLAVWTDQIDLLLEPFRNGLLEREQLMAAARFARSPAFDDFFIGLLDARAEQQELLVELAGRLRARGQGDVLMALGEMRPELRPQVFHWAAALGRRDVLVWLPELLAHPDAIEHVVEGLRSLLPQAQAEVLAILRPWSESISATAEWRSFLVLSEQLGLSDMRGRVEQAWRRADPGLRAAALAVLARFRLESARHYLTLAVVDESEEVRLAACEILAETATESVQGEVDVLLRDRHPWIRSQALKILLRIDAERARSTLIGHLGNDTSASVRIEALRSLRVLHEDRIADKVRALVDADDLDLRCEALRFLQMTQAPCRPEDLALLDDPHWRVRLEAGLWLLTGREVAEGVRARLEGEDDPDVRVMLLRIADAGAPGMAGERDRVRIWFRAISDHVYETSGIHLHTDNRVIYERKVQAVAESLRMPHLRDYYMRLRHHPHAVALTQELIEAITTGETYFHREASQLRTFFRSVLPTLPAPRPGHPRCIWSAGCSTGEEPYTLAIMALELGLGPESLRIIGGDINSGALTRAREGIYRDSAFRSCPPHWRSQWFEPLKDGRWRVTDRVRELVEFASLNLVNPASIRALPKPQAVFCRNVMIYFDRDARRSAVDGFEAALEPGGVLLLGHAESLLQLVHGLSVEHIDGEIIYRRPAPVVSP